MYLLHVVFVREIKNDCSCIGNVPIHTKKTTQINTHKITAIKRITETKNNK